MGLRNLRQRTELESPTMSKKIRDLVGVGFFFFFFLIKIFNLKINK